MRVPSCPRWPVAVAVVGAGYALVWYYSGALPEWAIQASVIGLGYAFLLCTSGRLVDSVLTWAQDEEAARAADEPPEAGDGLASPDGGQQAAPEQAADGEDDSATAGDDPVTDQDRDVGTIVGKAENLLLPTFILAEAYTALSVIFAAKGLVRREDIRKNTLYYLAGTMTNFTYSILVGVVLRIALAAAGVWPVPL